MTTPNQSNNVIVQPQAEIFSTFRRLNYTPWDALAEFIDNSIQSAREHLLPTVTVIIDTPDGYSMTLRDDAGGIADNDWQRALTPAWKRTYQGTSLSEFGMGMKAAATWLADTWRVTSRSRILEESHEVRSVEFSLPKLSQYKVGTALSLPMSRRVLQSSDDFPFGTEIQLTGMDNQKITTSARSQGKLIQQLSSIYQMFLDSSMAAQYKLPHLKILINGKPITSETLDIHFSRPVSHPDKAEIRWDRKQRATVILRGSPCDVDIRIWIRNKEMSQADAQGFMLFRRGRRVDNFLPNTKGLQMRGGPVFWCSGSPAISFSPTILMCLI